MGLFNILLSAGIGIAVGLVFRWIIRWRGSLTEHPSNGELLQTDPYVHPLNAPGDFYVLNEMCIACAAPEQEAPDLMAHEEQGHHCYFKRQPETREEIERACRAVEVGCCASVRYGGRDPKMLARLSQFGREACDHACDSP